MSYYRTLLAVGGYSPEYQIYLDRLTSLGIAQPDSNTKTKHNQAVLSIISAGLWGKIASLKFLWNSNLDAVTVDVKVPLQMLGTPNGGLGFTPNLGLIGNGTTAYFDTGFIPLTTNPSIFTQNSCGVFLYISQTFGTTIYIYGNAGNQRNRMNVQTVTTSRLNSGGSLSSAYGFGNNVGVKGFYRDNSTDLRLFRDKVKSTRTQGSLSSLMEPILLFRNSSNYNIGTLGGLLAFTASLTDAEHEILVDINNALIS
jgi:hypothetical protein